jgi:hypothetical protein
MKKKKAGAVLVVLLTCALTAQAFAQGQQPKFKSNADDNTKIGNLLEEFRQDIIRKDGSALTKARAEPNVLFITPTPRKRLIAPVNMTLSSMGSDRASWMDLQNSSLR